MKKIFLLLIAASFCFQIHAQLASADTLSQSADKSITHHSTKINGAVINYTATAGTVVLKNDKDEPVALFGFTAYTKDGETDVTKATC